MKLILINNNEEYSAREMIAAHIPKIKIEISKTIPAGEDYVVSEIHNMNSCPKCGAGGDLALQKKKH